MDRRTVYIQEILQAADFLQTQRDTVRAIATIADSLYGAQTVFIPQPGATAGTYTAPVLSGSALSIVTPWAYLYARANLDTAWPASPNTILAADANTAVIQGIDRGQTVTWSAPAGGTGSNTYYVVIDAQLNYPFDQNPQALPFAPLIQTIVVTNAGNSTTQFFVSNAVGMASGDVIRVQGSVTTTGHQYTTINTVNTGTGQIVINDTFTAVPTVGAVVQDLNPNQGNPLQGQGNTGNTLNLDRVAGISYFANVGAVGTPGAIPSGPHAAGWVTTWVIGPIVGNATNLTGVNPLGPPFHTVAPIAPQLVGAHHHKGTPGQSSQVDPLTELVYVPVNRAGDTMTGALQVPGDSGGAGAIPGYSFSGVAGADANPTNSTAGLRISHTGWLDVLTSGGTGLRWNALNATYLPVPFARIVANFYIGNGSGQSITFGFQPLVVLIFGVGSAATSGFLWGTNAYLLTPTASLGSIYANVQSPGLAAITSSGFQLYNTGFPLFNEGFVTHIYVALG